MKHIFLLCLLCLGINLSAQHTITFRIRNGQDSYLRKLDIYRKPYKDKLGTTDSTGSITIDGLVPGDTLTLAYGECPTYQYLVPAVAPIGPVEIQLQCMFRYPTDGNAAFPGDRMAWSRFLKENLVYPEKAAKERIEGKVYVRFQVDAEGKASDVSIAKTIPNCPECNAEAIRLIKLVPQWNPAIEKGKAMKSYLNMPVMFDLD